MDIHGYATIKNQGLNEQVSTLNNKKTENNTCGWAQWLTPVILAL